VNVNLRGRHSATALERGLSRASMRKIGTVLAFCLAVAGCDPPLSNLLLPMEPTRESIAAPRRALTSSEKDSISEAVTLKIGNSDHRDFRWAPLVVRSHGPETDYCGLVSRTDPAGLREVFSKYLAKLHFSQGALSKVDVISIDKLDSTGIPPIADSVGIQDGYDL
jgi:hypothetical protein